MTKCIRTREPRQSSGNGFHFMRNNQTNERIDTAYVLGGKVFGMQERFRKRERVRFPFFAKKGDRREGGVKNGRVTRP